MTEEQKEKVKRHLQAAPLDMSCQICGTREWSLQGRFHVLTAMNAEGNAEPDVGLPTVVLTCKGCRQVRMFDAAAIGLLDE